MDIVTTIIFAIIFASPIFLIIGAFCSTAEDIMIWNLSCHIAFKDYKEVHIPANEYVPLEFNNVMDMSNTLRSESDSNENV